MEKIDTIAALCTAPGGALAIIRISGPDALCISEKVWTGSHRLADLPPRRLSFGFALDENGGRGESCMAVYMPAPASYTGENVVEIQCHGGEYAPRRMLERILRAGARSAEPGEFTRRAFLNGKMDLTQAEAVADLIAAKNDSAGRIAERQLAGVLGARIRECYAKLSHLLAEIESRLDFPEENLDWQTPEALVIEFSAIRTELSGLLSTRRAGMVFRDGVKLVIAGAPNVGKSSLLNRLLGYDRAIVSDIPGTTRDTLRENASIRGISVDLSDTAGLRTETSDRIEALGIERSRSAIQFAEIIFWVLDASHSGKDGIEDMVKSVPAGAPVIAIWNKIDLVDENWNPPKTPFPSVSVSAETGKGMESLLDLFEKNVWENAEHTEPECAVSTRHAKLLEQAAESLDLTEREVQNGNYELAAANLRGALEAVAGITGEAVVPDILEDIFSRFCIGK